MKPITYTNSLKLLKETKEWVLEGDDIFVPQFLLAKGVPSTTFDDIGERYPELAWRIDEINRLDEAKIVGFMAKGKVSKNVGEFILNRYYPAEKGSPNGSGVVVHLEY